MEDSCLTKNRRFHKKECLHNLCEECKGSFSKDDGSLCRHSYRCNCRSCVELERIFIAKNEAERKKYA